MGLKEELDKANKELAELQETVKSHAEDRSTLDLDQLSESVIEIMDARDKAIADKKRDDDEPTRKGDQIGPETDPEAILAAVQQGDYELAKWLKARPRCGLYWSKLK